MATASTDELLKCNICLDRLNSPRALPCLHSFCETCLQQHVRTSHGSSSMTKDRFLCPTCRRPTNLTKEGVKAFPVDFRVNQLNDVLEELSTKQNLNVSVCDLCVTGTLGNQAEKYCLDCKKYFCTDCTIKHLTSEVLKSHNLMCAKNSNEDIRCCKEHKNEPIKYLCKSCDIGICLFCVLGNHEKHIITSPDDTPPVVKKSVLTDCLNHIDNQVSFLNERIFDISIKEERKRRTCANEKHTRDKKYKLIGLSADKKKCRNFTEERLYCYEYLLQFKMIEDKLEAIMKSGNVSLLLEFHSHILQEIQQIDVRTELSQSELNVESFRRSKEKLRLLSSFEKSNNNEKPYILCEGRVIRKSQNPSFTTIKTSMDTELLTINTSVDVGCRLRTARIPSYSHHSNMSTPLYHRQPYNPVKYQTSYNHKLRLIYKVGGYGQEAGCLNLPFGIAFLDNDTLVVAENGSGRIQMFDNSGYSREIIKLQHGYPRCVSTGYNNEIFITDEQNKCIKLVSKDTERKINLSKETIHFPYGISALRGGNVVVSDMIYERLTIINTSGDIVLQFGHYGNTNSTFDSPSYLSTDGDNILVSDSGHHQIKVFNKNGKFQHKIGHYGSDKGELKYPKGLAISPKGDIIVADSGNNRVVMFSETGDFIATLLDINDNIERPIDMACTPSGLLGVAMPDRHEVFVYKLNHSFLTYRH